MKSAFNAILQLCQDLTGSILPLTALLASDRCRGL